MAVYLYEDWSNEGSTQAPAVPNVTCVRSYSDDKNKTYFIYGGYEGIPDNLLINLGIWAVLLVVFVILRKAVWDYGRIAHVSRTAAVEQDGLSTNEESNEFLDSQGHCTVHFSHSDRRILERCGHDAVQYLTFQRYLLVYLCVVTVVCIVVVLPINFQGDLVGDKQTFGHTTIGNINPNSPTLWVHVALPIIFLVIAIVFMRRFSATMQYSHDDLVTRTIMVCNIPQDKCEKDRLLQHFTEAYPEDPVQDIQLAYNISKLMKLDKERRWNQEGLLKSEAILELSHSRPMMLPYACGQCCCCCETCGCKEVDAIEYYHEQEAMYSEKCEAETLHAYRQTLGIAFVTFEHSCGAARVVADFKESCTCTKDPALSMHNLDLNVSHWDVQYAEAKENYYWDNVSKSRVVWWIRAILVNFLLFIFLFVFTTPSVVINLLNEEGFEKAVGSFRYGPFVVQFTPTLMLLLVSNLLPLLVYYSDVCCVGHWTSTAEQHAVMRKTCIFLILMVLILPSLGLTSAKAMFDWFATRDDDAYKFRWSCIFMPDNGAFFVNYVITAAFIGSALALLRLPELLSYAFKIACAPSAAERSMVRKTVVNEFQFGLQYASMLCIFAVVMAFSIPCPLITPFGVVYVLMMHIVDRYNIYYVYKPSRINQNIHACAINFVIVAVILLQAFVLFFTILRAANLRGLTIFGMLALLVMLLIFCGRGCFGWFKDYSVIVYKKIASDTEADRVSGTQSDQHTPLLSESCNQSDDVAVMSPSSGQTYGTTDRVNQSIHA